MCKTPLFTKKRYAYLRETLINISRQKWESANSREAFFRALTLSRVNTVCYFLLQILFRIKFDIKHIRK